MVEVSVILPCRGHVNEMDSCLQAWAAQVERRFEVILVTDGDEECARVAETFTWTYEWLRHVQLETQHGVCMAARRGFWSSIGDLVYFGAMDDRVHPDFLYRSLELWDKYDGMYINDLPGLSHTANHICHPGHHDKRALSDGFHAAERGYHSPKALRAQPSRFTGATTIYRRDAALAAGLYFPELRSAADWFLSTVVAYRHGCLYEPASLVTCAVSPHTYSGGMDPDSTADIQRTLDSLVMCPDFADVCEDIHRYREWGRRGE
jgi:glycosyltransferase involved in cell wall biosynthesis